MSRLVLGSTSRYRTELLRRLVAQFEQRAPGSDETLRPGEAPADAALRLAILKAEGAGQGLADALVIGSDQIAELDGRALGKPGSVEGACTQLASCAGREVRFHTGVCLLDTRGGLRRTHLDTTRVRFRALTETEITRYVERERPLDCAGSFKCEGLGIALFERIDSSDPTALIGLPLIALARMLREAGLAVP
ncbi:Maf family nucleotide pyrophosphatase [Frateuria sp.]|uniref:Maf family protein n=1 Tax=Frateuria sp. TaxID=2211372 RepID=UPI001843EE3F|nr:Maf family nucleotide pyrophosphatase [Frateuria sp.]NUR24219.1 septum formation protein Maf [Frateuria sp.]